MSLCSLLLRSARIRQTAISVRPLLRRRYASEATLSTGLKPSRFGQPTLRSHPHLIQPGETTPGVPAHEYERRRRELMDALPEGSLIVAFSAPVKYMSAGIFYKYRQASDFWYLTGFEEPGSVVVLQKRGSQKGYYMTMYSTGRDPVKEQWEGSFTGHADIETIFGADDARPIDEFADNLHKHVAEASQIYADLPPSASKRKQTGRGLLKFLQVGRGRTDIEDLVGKFAGKIQPLAPRVGALRCVKSKYEQAVMRAAADISGRAHAKTMRFVEPGMSEADLHAHFEYLCARAGSQRPAYVPVVASGENALIIHYTKNHHLVRDGELVLMDAGCEYNGYASDISRTFPVSGKFTAPQAELYAAVLTVQKQLVELCVESGGASMNDLHRRSVELLRKELTQIGFDLNARSGILERVLYPHYLTHAVGIDLHEPNTYDRYKPLKEGMVITIEPGIYVPKTDAFPSEFRGIGIRIEDEVLVGKDHPVVLSAEAPKEIVDIEGACQGALGFEAF